jgi:predicted acyltransferase
MNVNLPSEVSTPGSAVGKASRITSLDQFRGYTVLGMLLVNYFGGYAVCPQILKHTHDYCSYADTIMPQFLFAVGFALRLTFGRRMQTEGSAAAWMRAVRRLIGLVLVAIVVYNVGPRAANWEQLKEMGPWEALYEPLKRGWFQTLMHIAVTSLWILPVVHKSQSIRIYWMVGSAIAHILLSYWFNFLWVNSPPNGIDGGPLGFLTWTVPAIVGTIACDVFVKTTDNPAKIPFGKVFFASLGLMLLGYVMSCGTRFYDVPEDQVDALRSEKLASDPVLPSLERVRGKLERDGLSGLLAEAPFVKPPEKEYRKWNYWMMSQRAGSLSYLTFSAGFSLLVFLAFYIACDLCHLHLPIFRTFGTNALIAYILHSMVSSTIQPFFPKDSPSWYAYTGLALFFFINWLFIRQLEKQNIFFRV